MRKAPSKEELSTAATTNVKATFPAGCSFSPSHLGMLLVPFARNELDFQRLPMLSCGFLE